MSENSVEWNKGGGEPKRSRAYLLESVRPRLPHLCTLYGPTVHLSPHTHSRHLLCRGFGSASSALSVAEDEMGVIGEEGGCGRGGRWVRSKERRCSLSRAAVTPRMVKGSESTARGLRCVTKETREVGAIRVKASVAEEVGGACGRRQSSCDQSELTLIGQGVGIISMVVGTYSGLSVQARDGLLPLEGMTGAQTSLNSNHWRLGAIGRLTDGFAAIRTQIDPPGVSPATQNSLPPKVCLLDPSAAGAVLALSPVAKDARSNGSPLPSASKSE